MSVWHAKKQFVSSISGWLLNVFATAFLAKRLLSPLRVFFKNTAQAAKKDYARYAIKKEPLNATAYVKHVESLALLTMFVKGDATAAKQPMSGWRSAHVTKNYVQCAFIKGFNPVNKLVRKWNEW